MTAIILAAAPCAAVFEAAGFTPAEASLLVEAFGTSTTTTGGAAAAAFALQAVCLRESASRFLALTADALGRPSDRL